MRSRGRTHLGKVVRSSISYHPQNLVVLSAEAPTGNQDRNWGAALQWMTKLIPPNHRAAWEAMCRWNPQKQYRPTSAEDNAAKDLTDFFSHCCYALPFRLPSLPELLKDLGLQVLLPYVEHEQDVLDLAGNCFAMQSLKLAIRN